MKRTLLITLVAVGTIILLSAPAGAVSALLEGGGKNLGTGDELHLSIGLSHTGSPVNIDAYLGLILPGGALVFFRVDPNGALVPASATLVPLTWSKLLANIPLQSGIDTGLIPLLNFQITSAWPSGDYLWAWIIVQAGTLNPLDFQLHPFKVVPYSVQSYYGNWSGTWNNTTFGSSGAVVISVEDGDNPGEIKMTVDLGGNVLGGTNPPPFTIMATLDASSGILIQDNAGPLGTADVTISPDGVINGSTTVGASGIDSVDLAGTIQSGSLSADYTVNFTVGAPAMGTMTATRQP